MTSKRRRRVLQLAGALVALGALGGAVVVSGVVPITASGGHFVVTRWFLNFAKERSVATHALFVDVDIDEPWLVMKGAGHYESGCLPCHGGPGRPVPRIAAAMLPSPPRLERRVADYSPEELFYLVKHGIKLTGMPAWPAQTRDDEIFAVVAFLDVLPSLDAASYNALVYGGRLATGALTLERDQGAQGVDLGPPSALTVSSLRDVVARCVRCHGTDGEGRGNAAFPKLAGQRSEYLFQALLAYRENRRHSGIMGPIAAALTDDEMRGLAAHFAALAPSRHEPSQTATPQDLERGADIAARGIPERLVPPCALCHDGRRSPAYPILSSQYAAYIELQLRLFRTKTRGGSPFADLMHLPAHALADDEGRAVARYYEAGAP